MLWMLPMIMPNFVEEPPVKASKVTNRSSSPAPCLEQDLMCTLVASSRTKRKERG